MTDIQLKFEKSFCEAWELLQQRNKGKLTTEEFQKEIHKLNPYPRKSEEYSDFKDTLQELFDKADTDEHFAENELYVFNGENSIVELFNLNLEDEE